MLVIPSPKIQSVIDGEPPMIVAPDPPEQTRARYPDQEGYVERDGVRVFYEVYGDAPTTFLLFPTSPISHSRLWKAQIPYLSRHFRVITFDPRGNGRSGRPDTAEAYAYWEFVQDGRAILEATRTNTALLAGSCDGGGWALMLAATQPTMALGVVAIAPCVPRLGPSHPNYRRYPSLEPARMRRRRCRLRARRRPARCAAGFAARCWWSMASWMGASRASAPPPSPS
jgi:pimeloyl-ACP methyl ester carboxylesterase